MRWKCTSEKNTIDTQVRNIWQSALNSDVYLSWCWCNFLIYLVCSSYVFVLFCFLYSSRFVHLKGKVLNRKCHVKTIKQKMREKTAQMIFECKWDLVIFFALWSNECFNLLFFLPVILSTWKNIFLEKNSSNLIEIFREISHLRKQKWKHPRKNIFQKKCYQFIKIFGYILSFVYIYFATMISSMYARCA